MDDTNSTIGGPPPPGIAKDDIIYDEENPNRATAVPPGEGDTTLEHARAQMVDSSGTFPDIVEGSDSGRTGTSWGMPAAEDAEMVDTPSGLATEGTGEGDAHPNRNVGDSSERDSLEDVGSWSTIETKDSAGSPTGNS